MHEKKQVVINYFEEKLLPSKHCFQIIFTIKFYPHLYFRASKMKNFVPIVDKIQGTTKFADKIFKRDIPSLRTVKNLFIFNIM